MFEYLENTGSQERVVSVTLLEVQSFKCKWLSITVEKKETPLYLCFHTYVCNKETRNSCLTNQKEGSRDCVKEN